MDILKEILLWPCYLVFVFIGAILLIISLFTNNYIEQIWIFFIYSITGLVWRYIEKDIDSGIQEIIAEDKNKKISHLVVIVIYHLGNIALLLSLLYYINI